MPAVMVNATISPTFSSTEAALDAVNNAAFYNEAAAIRKLGGTNTRRATLAHYEKVFVFLVDPKSSKAASLYSFLIACAAFASCFMLFLQTLDGPNHQSTFPDYPGLPNEAGYALSDLVFTVIFTLELLVRMAIWPSFWKEHEYLTERRLRPFLRDAFNWFDVAAVAPFYSDLVLGKDKSFVLLRLCRLLRIFKLARNHSGTYILLRAIRASLAPISIALIFFMEIVFFFSVVMYMVDPNLDRSKNGFSDLLTAGYFVVVTIATIGYGDITPTKGNMPGRLFTVMIIMSGTLFLSMPLAIIGTEFDRAWKEHAESVKKYQALGGVDLTAVNDSEREKKHEVLIKYNAPSRMYLRLAGLTGEASLMVQALSTETASDDDFSVTRTLEIAEDLQQQVATCAAKCEELGALVKEMVVPHIEQAPEKPTWYTWLFVTLSDSSSSLLAKCIAKWVRYCQIASMVVVVFQTMPDLQTYGETTFLCERIVKRYCESAAGVVPLQDPGCFRVDSPMLPIRFGCSDDEKANDPSCFGFGLNYGSSDVHGLTCDNGTTLTSKVSANDTEEVETTATAAATTAATTANLTHYVGDLTMINPFRLDEDLSKADRKLAVCKKWECDNLHVTFFEFGSVYVAAEYLFTATYVFEFAAAMFVSHDRLTYLKNPIIIVEMLSFVPFFVLEGSALMANAPAPIYVIPPGSNDWLTFLRLLRLSRMFKIQQSIPVTKVLWESISKTSTRLTIPYFMLMVVTTIFSFVMYELEKGQECFYGHECVVNGKNMTFPPELVGSPLNKRFLVNLKGNLSTFDDFFSAFWFVIVTVCTIGYGDMEPVSPSGKLVAVGAMIFGACYTAMPLTLVGSQFNKSYREHKRREALLRTKVEVSKPFAIPKSDFQAWDEFAKNGAFQHMQLLADTELVPVLLQMRDEETIDPIKKTRVASAAKELRDAIYQERVRRCVDCGWMDGWMRGCAVLTLFLFACACSSR